jgi:hypothetical protein
LELSPGAADAEPVAVEEAANLEPGEKDAEHRGSQRQPVQLRSAKACKIKQEVPPWRSASSKGFEQDLRSDEQIDSSDEAESGFVWMERGAAAKANSSRREDQPLAGVRDVVPRWKVEEKLQRERAGQNQPYSDVLLGKVATQLLRWGRSDLQAEGGTTKTIKLVGWKAGAWVTIEHLAETMGVLPKQLSKDVLETCGKHGQRLLFQERQGGLGPQVKANWAER